MIWLQTLWVTKKVQAVVKELFIRCRKLNISFVFIAVFFVPKDITLNSTHFLIIKINNKRELQNIAITRSAGIYYKDFVKIYGDCTSEPYSFFTINTTLPLSNPLRFLKKSFWFFIKMTLTE